MFIISDSTQINKNITYNVFPIPDKIPFLNSSDNSFILHKPQVTYTESMFKSNLLQPSHISINQNIYHVQSWILFLMIAVGVLIILINKWIHGFIKQAFYNIFHFNENINFFQISRIIPYFFSCLSLSLSAPLIVLIAERNYHSITIPFEFWTLYLIIAAAIGCFSFSKIIFTYIFGYIFNEKQTYKNISDGICYNFMILSSFILFFSIFGIYSKYSFSKVTILIILILMAVFYTLRILKIIYLSLTQRGISIINLFLYLCIVEIIPVFYSIGLYKLLNYSDFA